MTATLAALFVVVEALDALTYLQISHLESNPIMAALPPLAAVTLKAAGVTLALLVASRISTPWMRALALGAGIAIGAFGAGTNVAALSMVLR